MTRVLTGRYHQPVSEIVYVASALLGALVGGLVSFAVSALNARRERRIRYGEALLKSLGAAQQRVSATAHVDAAHPLILREEAGSIWIEAKLMSTLERRAGRRGLETWSSGLYDTMVSGIVDEGEVDRLQHRLEVAVFLVIAWTARYANGRDFTRPEEDIEKFFGPDLYH